MMRDFWMSISILHLHRHVSDQENGDDGIGDQGWRD